MITEGETLVRFRTDVVGVGSPSGHVVSPSEGAAKSSKRPLQAPQALGVLEGAVSPPLTPPGLYLLQSHKELRTPGVRHLSVGTTRAPVLFSRFPKTPRLQERSAAASRLFRALGARLLVGPPATVTRTQAWRPQ